MNTMTTMTDEELDRDWKPSGRRPQSTIARSFSAELMDIFRIENSVADLDKHVNEKKQQINTQTSELEALEARIREMEQRLKTQGPVNGNNQNGRAGSPRTQRPAVGNAFDNPNAPPVPPAKDGAQQHKYGGGRPQQTTRQGQQAVPGALPPTPVGSEGECELVTRPHRVPRPPTQSSSTTTTARAKVIAEDDSGSTKSMSESASFADYVIVAGPDGDREQDA
ncbi:hypothetical protein B0H63DRAFT_138653 [Podospora didyma]|uniref:Uncharacterized protein n=1 Tax=Podospora didyma TaxID=330526 RepID=A0AAE0NSB1_9PEZI|nr:hypothetical protein B0H63DRAFT_138653 [Podospora didyma]